MSTGLDEYDADSLRGYRPAIAAPPRLDEYWARTIEQARASAVPPTLTPVREPVRALEIQDLTFSGFAGERIRAWLIRPHGTTELPVVVEFVGYGGGRGLPGERLAWAAAGYAHVVMDTRGQGSAWSAGDTPDPHGSDPAVPGFMTRGIADPETYYYRRLITDAVRLVETVAELPGIDASRLAVTGTSQGGGLAIAAAALAPGVAALLADVPFLCDFPRAIERAISTPFTEITSYLAVHRGREQDVLHTLAHVDGVVLARNVTAPALFSVAMRDEVVLPSGVFAAFNALASSDRELAVYPHNGHEGGGAFHWHRQVAWLDRRMGVTTSTQ